MTFHNIIITILLAIILCTCLFTVGEVKCQETGKWRWANDTWNSTQGKMIKYDKLEHACGTAFLYGSMRQMLGVKRKYALIITIGFALLWEVKDALIPWEEHGSIGGDGFSWRDLVADIVGLLTFNVGDLTIRLNYAIPRH